MRGLALILVACFVVGCATATPVPTATFTPTPTATATATPVPTATFTPTPTASPDPRPPGVGFVVDCRQGSCTFKPDDPPRWNVIEWSDSNKTADIRSRSTNYGDRSALRMWCDERGFGISMDFDKDFDVFSISLNPGYHYVLDGRDSRYSRWTWGSPNVHLVMNPRIFLSEIRTATLLKLTSDFTSFGVEIEVIFDLTGIEWAVSQLPCVS